MLEGYAVFVEGLKDEIAQLDKLSEAKLNALARQAINETLPVARGLAARSMEQQNNFPRGYLTGRNGRLAIAQRATDDNLEGIIRGRDRPTSLARFITRAPAKGKKGVTVEVNPHQPKELPGAFIVKLRNNNQGLAVRSNKRPTSKGGAKQLDSGLWLLYGPSVDQVFNETRKQVAPDIEDALATKFRSLLERELA